MSPLRRCSRIACTAPAVATLTYAYADSTAVVGPLATYAEPHCYDLCQRHAVRLTTPLGWEVLLAAARHRSADGTTDDEPVLAGQRQVAWVTRTALVSPVGIADVVVARTT